MFHSCTRQPSETVTVLHMPEKFFDSSCKNYWSNEPVDGNFHWSTGNFSHWSWTSRPVGISSPAYVRNIACNIPTTWRWACGDQWTHTHTNASLLSSAFSFKCHPLSLWVTVLLQEDVCPYVPVYYSFLQFSRSFPPKFTTENKTYHSCKR